MSDQADRWLNWEPPEPIMADSTKGEPTKPSKPGSVGFDGSLSGVPANIDALHNATVLLAEGDWEAPVPPIVDSVAATEGVMSWAEWRAAALNRLFLEQGTTGQPGRISAQTVRHGERRQEDGALDE
jgi:hypothetical protein